MNASSSAVVLDAPSLARAARAIRRGTVSPVELAEACLTRTAAFDPVVHAFAVLDADGARGAARDAEHALRAGEWRGPLHGVPVGIKDVIDVHGLPTRAHSRQLADAAPAMRDAAAVGRWRDGGAVVLGKLTTHEFSFGTAEWDAAGPPACNPWMPSRFAGGSSSGPAVAVACGMVLGALGTDTAGSVRSPAALCGVSGFKPSIARLDRRGAIPLAPSLDALGVLARSAEDCAILYATLVDREDTVRRACDEDGVPRLDPDLRGLRIGVVRPFFDGDAAVSAPCADAVARALTIFEELGCRLFDVTLPPLGQWHATGITILLKEAYADHEERLRTRPDRYGESFRKAVLAGADLTGHDYANALQQRMALTGAFDAVMREADVLVCPIQRAEAPPFEALSWRDFLDRPSFGLPFNLADAPALSVCCGFGPSGLPLALQLVGRRGDELTVLRAGHAYETATRWLQRRPHLETEYEIT